MSELFKPDQTLKQLLPGGSGSVPKHMQRGERARKPLSKLNFKCDWCGKRSDEVAHVIRVVKLPRNY